MAVKHNNAFTNLVTGCLYWLTTCFSQLYDHHQVYHMLALIDLMMVI